MPNDVASTEAARGVLSRTFGAAAKKFDLRLVASPRGEETFTVEAKDGRVRVDGSTLVAITRGAYEYVKDACHVQVSWSVKTPPLPARLPDYASRTVRCPNEYRHYFNVCTFGYTTVWWDWARWQREIDWMALHGINMPLAMNGQEFVWQKVFRSLGVSDESLRKHFSGPAFLPWHRMGNLNRHMGPLPQSWIDGQAQLQRSILRRERELGMKPVVPGFSGFVPVDFDKAHPEVKLQSPSTWAGFDATTFVDVRSPMFVEIGRRFVQEYRRQFGSDHLYLCDTFNEQNPPFPPETKLQDLAAAGRAVYESIRQGDPDGVWVMQGWLFYNARDYWHEAEASAMLGAVPPGRMIVLDLASNEHEVWREQPALPKTGWIFNTLHNYGQATLLGGRLQTFADRAHAAINDPTRGRMLGMGLTPEGIDQNPVVYELMTDLMWRTDHVKVSDWIRGYVASRYGSASPAALSAWKTLLAEIYQDANPWYRGSWPVRPTSGGAQMPPYHLDRLQQAVADLVAAEPQPNDALRRDVVDVAKTWLGGLADFELAAATLTRRQDPAGSRRHRDRFFGMLADLDRLMATRPEHRLSTWVRAAERWGRTPAERDLMRANARTQITTWGGPVLFDYANKEWAGLIKGFIAPRWKMMFASLDRPGSKAPDFGTWETAWGLGDTVDESKAGDEITVAQELLAKYRGPAPSLEATLGLDPDPGIAVGKPVRDSGGTEPGGDPKHAVDGTITGSFWSASPAPQWLEVDLQAPMEVRGVRLFPYCADQRFYQYRVQLSNDGQAWETVVDGSANVEPATVVGYAHSWTPRPARYIRVTMLNNSANVGVHLHEFRVYGTVRTPAASATFRP